MDHSVTDGRNRWQSRLLIQPFDQGLCDGPKACRVDNSTDLLAFVQVIELERGILESNSIVLAV